MFHRVSNVVLCDKRITFAWVSKDSLHLAWQTRQYRCPCCFYFLNHNARVASSGGIKQIVWQAWDVVKVPFDVEGAVIPFCAPGATFGTLYGLDFSFRTLHFTLHALHLAPNGRHSAISTYFHSTLCTLNFELRTAHSTPHPALHALHFHSTFHTLHLTPHTTFGTLHSTVCTPHSALFHSPHYTLHFTLFT